jgi:hypothetical protein
MKIETKPQKPRDKKNLLFGRVQKIKELLPKDWRKRLSIQYPQYDSLEMADLLSRVHSLRAADESLTVILETIANTYQDELRADEKLLARIRNRQKLVLA